LELWSLRQRRSDVFRIRLVFLHVAAFLPLVIDGIFLYVRLIHIVGGHAERLRE